MRDRLVWNRTIRKLRRFGRSSDARLCRGRNKKRPGCALSLHTRSIWLSASRSTRSPWWPVRDRAPRRPYPLHRPAAGRSWASGRSACPTPGDRTDRPGHPRRRPCPAPASACARSACGDAMADRFRSRHRSVALLLRSSFFPLLPFVAIRTGFARSSKLIKIAVLRPKVNNPSHPPLILRGGVNKQSKTPS